jgi:hypothetical protein
VFVIERYEKPADIWLSSKFAKILKRFCKRLFFSGAITGFCSRLSRGVAWVWVSTASGSAAKCLLFIAFQQGQGSNTRRVEGSGERKNAAGRGDSRKGRRLSERYLTVTILFREESYSVKSKSQAFFHVDDGERQTWNERNLAMLALDVSPGEVEWHPGEGCAHL